MPVVGMHAVWWKLALSAFVGFVLGIAVVATPIYWLAFRAPDMREHYIPTQWSSAGKDWPAFAYFLRHGGRRLIRDAAFSAAKDGMSEAEVREVFGPPDFVVAGNDEFDAYPVTHMKGLGASGAYFYKVGPFAERSDEIDNEAFAIIFGSTGKTVYGMGLSTNVGDRLTDIDSDTRSERRIAP
jgi:hypothetical protein